MKKYEKRGSMDGLAWTGKGQLWAIICLSGILAFAYSAAAQNTELTVRLANPTFDCDTDVYCVDVEFQSDTADEELFGMNLRFFYDSNELIFLDVTAFEDGYVLDGLPEVTLGGAASGAPFTFSGPAEFVNANIQNTLSEPAIVIDDTGGWTRLYSLCFTVIDPYPGGLGLDFFCPSIVLDLQVNPDDGGFLHGSNGVVMTVVDDRGAFTSLPTDEQVEQFNWVYAPTGASYWGSPYPTLDECLDTYCPGIEVLKEAILINGIEPDPFVMLAADDVITYNIQVWNTGNSHLGNVYVDDLQATTGPYYVAGDGNGNGVLNTDEVWVYTATYVVTQADMDAGQFTNVVDVQGMAPDGTVVFNSDSEIVLAGQEPGLIVTKAATAPNPAIYTGVGQVIEYTITVENSGNVTVTDIVVEDPLTMLNQTIVTLAPGVVETIVTSYTTTAVDLNVGFIMNEATALGEDPNGDPVSGEDSEMVAAAWNAIIANDDDYCGTPVDGFIGGSPGNALDNDTLHEAPVNVADVTVTVLIPATPKKPGYLVPVLNTATGEVDVPPGTPAGTYTIIYRICENDNPANCDTATITVCVGVGQIIANDDFYGPVIGVDGDPDMGNALDNDTINGVPVLPPPAIGISVLTPATVPGVVLNTLTGVVSVAPGTPAGVYTITYRIYEYLNPTNFDDAVITVEVICVTIEASVFLEGALIDPDNPANYAALMRTDLNGERVLPGQAYDDVFSGLVVYTQPGQPYSAAPWLYNGTEGQAFDSLGDPADGDAGYADTVVDWVLVSLRDTDDPVYNTVCQAAALLHNDGTIEFLGADFGCCSLSGLVDYYLVIEHRNHLIVMSDVPVAVDPAGVVIYDFRIQQSYLNDPLGGGLVAQKEVVPGVFALFGGNGDQVSSPDADTDINTADRDFWASENRTYGQYRFGDYNLDGDAEFNDRTLWELNNGESTSVPRN